MSRTLPSFSSTERKLISAVFRHLVIDGALVLRFGSGDEVRIGEGVPSLVITPPKLLDLVSILLNPELQAGEKYVNQKWHIEEGELIDLIQFFSIQEGTLFKRWHDFYSAQANFTYIFNQYISPKIQTRKTRNHYNIDDRIFRIIIGESMVYSCAFFDSENDTLETAQERKLDVTIERLDIPSNDKCSLLDIGCGWGALAVRAAKKYPYLHVLGVSISETQIQYANDKLRKEYPYLVDRVEFKLIDFDDLAGLKFDRIVSVGMLEHVGKQFLGEYFKKVQNCLNRNGLALIHSIVTQHVTPKNSWADRYVFTGAYVPQTSEVVKAIEYSDMTLKNVFIHGGENYRRTLEMWLGNLDSKRDKFDACVLNALTDVGHSANERLFHAEKVYRIWQFYLSATQRFFRKDMYNNNICQFQIRNE